MLVRPTLLHRMALVSFLLFRNGQLARIFWANGLPPPPHPGKKLTVRLCVHRYIERVQTVYIGVYKMYIVVYKVYRGRYEEYKSCI